MRPTALVYQAVLAAGHDPASVTEVPDDACWLCGGPTEHRGQPLRAMISATFTDAGCAAGIGASVCEACCWCLKHKPLRTRSVLATPAGLTQPLRSEWRHILVSPPEPPWLGTIAISGKKHLVFKGRATVDNRRPSVMMEETPVEYQPAQIERDIELIEDMLSVFSKGAIRSGQYGQHRILQAGLSRFAAWLERVEELRHRRRHFDLSLLVAVIPEREKRTKPATPAVAIAQAQEVLADDHGDLPLFGARA